MQTYTGFTATTPDALLLDAGAYFKNFRIGIDTFDSAVLAGKLVGATSGGGTFAAVPEVRQIPIDGIKGDAKGMTVFDGWKVTIMANIKEVTADTIRMSLGASSIEDGPTGYNKIRAANEVKLYDYIDNITWVGRLSGSKQPVVIVVENALATGGITLNMADKSEGLLATTFTGHYDLTDNNSPPFAVYYPKKIVNTATAAVTTFDKAAQADLEFTLTSSSDAKVIDVKLGRITLGVGNFTVTGAVTKISKDFLKLLENGTYIFELITDKGNNVNTATITVSG